MKKAQSSFEMLVTFMVAITLLLPAVVYVITVQSNYSDSYKLNLAQNVVNKLAEASDTIFLQGEPSKITLTLQFPEGISKTDVSGSSILVRVSTNSGGNDIVKATKEPVTGILPQTSGVYKIIVENKGDSIRICAEQDSSCLQSG